MIIKLGVVYNTSLDNILIKLESLLSQIRVNLFHMIIVLRNRSNVINTRNIWKDEFRNKTVEVTVSKMK